MIDTLLDRLLIPIIIIGFVVLVVAIVVNGMLMEQRFANDCSRLQGHTYGEGLTLCVDDQGHLLEARP